MGWDIGNSLGGSMYFSPSSIPVPAVKGAKGEMFLNPLHSALDLQVVALPGKKNEITGYVGISFDGGKNNGQLLKLSSIYIRYREFLIGYNYSLFTDVQSLPKTISSCGVNGNDWSKGYQISYNSPSYSGFKWGASLEIPSFNEYSGEYDGSDYPVLDGTQFYANATQSIPDIPFYIEYKWKNTSHIRLSGLVRNFKYIDKVSDEVDIVTGVGMQASGAIKIIKPITILGQFIYGKGIGHYMSGISYLPYSYLPSNSRPGKLDATKMMGWLIGLKGYCSEKIFINLTYGQTRIYDSALYNKDFRYGEDLRASIFWNIKPYIQTGIEYLYGKRHTNMGTKGTDNRIQTMIMFSL